VHLCLAGGGTPRRAYELLAARDDVPWAALRVYLGDERLVPPDDAASNARLVRETLGRPGRLPAAALHVMLDAAPPDAAAPAGVVERFADEAARAYERVLPARLDVLVLGVGADGHTASLFPHAPVLAERERRVVPARAPTAPHARLTITPPVIAAARRVLVLASGAGKAQAVAAALEGAADPRACPAQLARGGTWLLDRAAAARLGGVDILPP
jgi:6-phosphogluconolactonase